MTGHIVLLIMIMLITGVFSGLINFQLTLQREKEKASLVRCITISTGAAFLVPVILNLTSNELVVLSYDQPSKMLIFIGLCILAGVSSKLFISNVADLTLSEARMATTRAEQIQRELSQIQADIFPLMETETEEEPNADSCVIVPEDERELLDITSTMILKTLDSGRHIFRSLKSVCLETNTDEATVTRTLHIMLQRSMVGRSISSKGVRWYITERGRRILRMPS
jgi:hypothetical protein